MNNLTILTVKSKDLATKFLSESDAMLMVTVACKYDIFGENINADAVAADGYYHDEFGEYYHEEYGYDGCTFTVTDGEKYLRIAL